MNALLSDSAVTGVIVLLSLLRSIINFCPCLCVPVLTEDRKYHFFRYATAAKQCSLNMIFVLYLYLYYCLLLLVY